MGEHPSVAIFLMVNQLILIILLLMLVVQRMKPSKETPTTRQFTYNQDILAGFEKWLDRTIQIYMTRYIEEKMGKELLVERDLRMDSEFALTGIDYVCEGISSTIPDFYHAYMSNFQGEDKHLSSIYERVRSIFVMYTAQELKKRLDGEGR